MRKISCFLFLLYAVSCGSKDKKIPLDEVEKDLVVHGERIISDFIHHASNVDQYTDFAKKPYITPLVYRGVGPQGLYSIAPIQMRMEAGTITSYKLIKVEDTGLVWHMMYAVTCELKEKGNIYLAIDINKEYELAKIYFYVKNNGTYKTDKKWINLFSDDLFL